MKKGFARIYTDVYVPTLVRAISAPYTVLTVKSVDFEGRKVSTSQFVEENPRERYKGMRASDFAMENQVAMGVPQKLSMFQFSTNELDYQIGLANNIKVSQDGK